MRFKIFAILLIMAPAVLADAATIVYVLRHAEKTTEPKNDPILTTQGKQRAENLSSLLCNENIAAVFSTDYGRTRQTVEPLANCLKTEIQLYDPSQSEELINNVITNFRGSRVVIVGHSNTVGGLLKSFGATNAPELTEANYGDLFVIDITDGFDVAVERNTY